MGNLAGGKQNVLHSGAETSSINVVAIFGHKRLWSKLMD